MALTATCPSCGAPVVFRSASSVFAVCEYCQSTLVRHDQALEDIGKMAALAEDRSPLQLGAEGRWHGLHFAIIGRIQLRYSQGLWNEWHILFDDMRTGWLSEAAGEYVVSFLHQVREPLPAFAELVPGRRLTLASRVWTVTNVEEAECVAGQGELPFKVGAGYKAPVADLRDGDNFATLDYSEDPPLFFAGSPVPFKSLQMSHLRDGAAVPEATVQARVFRCPSCGSPMSARSADILSVGCAACGAVVDASDANYRMLSKALGPRDEQYAPRLPLGSKGMLEGKPVEVIGFLVRETKVDGIAYDWREYLLATEHGTYRWLVEYNGHWNVVDVLSRHPTVLPGGGVRHDGEAFRHFSGGKATVIQVAGEFTWRVARGEEAETADYVAPPRMLSRETTGKEISWSLGRYAEPAEIQAAFKLSAALPAPIGIYADQPNRWGDTHRRSCRLFWRLLLLALVLQAGFAFLHSGGRTLLREELLLSPQAAEETLATRPFEIKGRPAKLVVRNRTTLDNNWIGLGLTLVNRQTGAAWPAVREIAYYSGVDSDGRWTEGSPEDEVVFVDIPPGTYYLAVDPDFPPDKPVAVRDVLEVATGGPGWSNFILLTLFLAVFPVFTRLRHGAFEAGRWLESDHAPADGDGGGDDD